MVPEVEVEKMYNNNKWRIHSDTDTPAAHNFLKLLIRAGLIIFHSPGTMRSSRQRGLRQCKTNFLHKYRIRKKKNNYSTGRPTHGERAYDEMKKHTAFNKNIKCLCDVFKGAVLVMPFVTGYDKNAREIEDLSDNTITLKKFISRAKACVDITFRYPLGVLPLMQVIIRGDYDLKSHAHAKGSKSFEYLDKDTNDRFIPQVIECSVSFEWLVFALISSAYKEDEVHEKLRSYLGFNPTIAPVKVTVLPLDKTNKSLVEIARKLSNKLRRRWNITVDVSGSIGKR